jgi:catechol 2,3-dioxygenase-like lactoylglutathione lyase family enzyme
MIKTHGLSHVALAVRDPERSLMFYQSVFGVREYFRSDSTIQVLGPGPHDVLAFERRPCPRASPRSSPRAPHVMSNRYCVRTNECWHPPRIGFILIPGHRATRMTRAD